MSNGLKNLFIFAAGAVVGAVAGIKLAKDRIQQDAQEEIEEVREYYKNKEKNKAEEEKKVEKPVDEVADEPLVTDVDVEKYHYIVDESGYVNYTKYAKESNENIKEGDIVDDKYDAPFTIDVEEYGENPEYDTMTLTYFADGVLVDDVDDLVDDPDTVVGLDNLKIFEEFDGCQAIYVRNDVWKTDFEILKDDWNYSDLQDVPSTNSDKKPHQL